MKLIASLKIWIVIYPSINLFHYIFGEQLSILPLYIRTFLLTITLVPWMVFVGLPLADNILRLLQRKSNRNR
ncbi:hypothetical protein [Pedobacter sp. SYSU D00535]|uniref:hypothetical protein n=1 Tax=Pedobacter sp. SYSU D00535 TaxID=2810308 RepID=UPI001A96DD00|nr:hypothetical protein [Pedobacter sp. SYSU D00535]